MQTLLKRWTHALLEWLGLTSATGDALDRWAAFVLVVLAAVVFDLLLQLGIVHGVRKLVERTRAKWDDTLFSVPVLRRMCHILSAILLAVVLPVVFEEKSTGRVIVLRFMEAYIVFSVFRFVNALLYAAFHIAAARPAWQNKPIKGLRQTAQGIALLICTILIVSILLDKSPAILLTGLGASAAVLMLIFRDSILGFVSGIQLAANDMLKVGDWISIPKYGADGNVEEVSLTTVKIRNWDNTLVMLPPYLLTTDSFTNWHAMQLSGGRRVMRSVAIDMTSVRFCTPEMLDHYRTIDLIRDYVDQTERRVEEYNAAHGIGSGERRINGLHQTNLGVFPGLSGPLPSERGSGEQGYDADGAAVAAHRNGASDAALFLYRYGRVGGLRGDSVGCLRSCAGRDSRIRVAGLSESVGGGRRLAAQCVFSKRADTPADTPADTSAGVTAGLLTGRPAKAAGGTARPGGG